MSELKFTHPHTLFKDADSKLKAVGAESFFKNPAEDVKKAREAFQIFFFALALKKQTKRDWWLYQPNQAERAYPDFDLLSFSESGKIEKFNIELTGAYPHFKDFNELKKVIDKKKKQYGKRKLDFSLLIFVNNIKSIQWVNLLNHLIKSPEPFISIWTLHLLSNETQTEIKKVVATCIAPKLSVPILIDIEDDEIYKLQDIPDFMEGELVNGNIYYRLKKDRLNKT